MKKLFVLISFTTIILPVNTIAQISEKLYNNLHESIQPKNKNSITDKERAALISGFTSDQINAFTKEVLDIVESGKKKIETTNDQYLRVMYSLAIANFYVTDGVYDNAIPYYQKTIKYAGDNIKYNYDIAEAYAQLGAIYSYKIKPDSAINFLHKALDKGDQKDSLFMCRIYNGYESLYRNLGLYEQSLEYSKKYKTILPAIYSWGEDYTMTVINIAEMYNNLYRETKLVKYKDSSLSILREVLDRKKTESELWYASCYFFMGELKYYDSLYNDAIQLFDSSLLPKYITQNLRTSRIPNRCRLERAICLIKLSNTEAVKILDTLSLNKRDFFSFQIKSKALYEYAIEKGNWKEAFENYQKYIQYTDSLDLVTTRGRIFETNQKYSVAQKEIEIQSLENKNLKEKDIKTKIVTGSIIAVVVLLLIILFLYTYNKRAQIKRLAERQKLVDDLQSMEREMELSHLQQQAEKEAAITAQRKTISQNMHDEVSSSLAALRFLIADVKQNMSNNGTVPVEVLDDLEQEAQSVYLQARSFMHQLNSSSVPENYNIIEFLHNLSRRFNEHSGLQINIKIDDGIESYLTPQQHAELYRIIKEAVANCMKHSGANIIHIKLSHKDGYFHFEIEDNGKGLTKSYGTGIGIEAMKQRIESLKGNLQISASEKGTKINGNFPE